MKTLIQRYCSSHFDEMYLEIQVYLLFQAENTVVELLSGSKGSGVIVKE